MQTTLREDAEAIVRGAIEDNLPGQAVRQALENLLAPGGRIVLIAVGKAAWTMGKEAAEVLGDALDSGLVITKYNHVKVRVRGGLSSCIIAEKQSIFCPILTQKRPENVLDLCER
jgi:hydroxypyruvate reductase